MDADRKQLRALGLLLIASITGSSTPPINFRHPRWVYLALGEVSCRHNEVSTCNLRPKSETPVPNFAKA